MAFTTDKPNQQALLVSPDWLAEHLGRPSVKVVDVRPSGAYVQGHIPDAIHLPMSALQTFRDGTPEMLVDQSAFEERVGQAGIGMEDTLVFYDDMWGMLAARVLWAFERYGHRAVCLLDGGWDGWVGEGRPTTKEATRFPPAVYRATPVDERDAPHDWVRAHLGDARVLLLDARSPNEYAHGHLPGAVNWEWTRALPADGYFLRPAEEIRAELEALGITPDKEIVAYCQSGARSAHVYFVLRCLGYPRVRNYDGSWLAWSLKEVRRE